MNRLIRNALAVVLLCLLISIVDVGELWSALRNLTASSIFSLALLAVALIYVSALKWKLFLVSLGQTASLQKLFNLYVVGYFINLLMPSYVGGDVVRSLYLGRDVGQHEAFMATLLERYTGLCAMLVLGCLSLALVPNVTVEIQLAVITLLLGLAAATALALADRTTRYLEFGRLARFGQRARRVQEAVRLALRNPKLLAVTLALSFLYHCLTVVNTMVAAQAVGWSNPPVFELFVVLPLILLVGALPLTPSGLGLQEGAFFYFLSSIGATPAQAFGVALVLRAKGYVIALVGWFLWLRTQRSK